jgi:hypothetical protein
MASDKFKNYRDSYLSSDMYIYACQHNSNPSHGEVPLKIIYKKRPAIFAVDLLTQKSYPLITQSQNDHHLNISRSFSSLCEGAALRHVVAEAGGNVGHQNNNKKRGPLLIYCLYDEYHTILCLRSVSFGI